MNSAVNGMNAEGNNAAQAVQAYNTHQQAMFHEISLFGNFPVAQIQQQLATIQATLNQSIDLSSAR
jgi:hypothetical protein